MQAGTAAATYVTVGWTQQEAIELCKILEPFMSALKCHVALTGGCLYSDGIRKDCDIVFYAVRGTKLDYEKIKAMLAYVGIEVTHGSGWLLKARRMNKDGHWQLIDCLFPEDPDHRTDYKKWQDGQQEVIDRLDSRIPRP